MIVKYSRVSTLSQTGNRFLLDTEKYDLILLDKISGKVPFKERPESKKLVDLVNNKKVTLLVVEELSRLGRSLIDTLETLKWLEDNKVNVKIKNIGIESFPNGTKNPIFDIVTSILGSMYQLEVDSIKERTKMGRLVFVNNGGRLGRPKGTNENDKRFLEKEKNQKIIKYLNRDFTIREISDILKVSTKTIVKVKKTYFKVNSEF